MNQGFAQNTYAAPVQNGYNQNPYSNPVQNTNNAFDSTFNANDSLDIASDDLPF